MQRKFQQEFCVVDRECSKYLKNQKEERSLGYFFFPFPGLFGVAGSVVSGAVVSRIVDCQIEVYY